MTTAPTPKAAARRPANLTAWPASKLPTTTVVVNFEGPTPFPYTAFVGGEPGHPGRPVRRLPRRPGARMHRCQLRPDRHRPVRGHRIPAQRRDHHGRERELPRSGQTGLRHRDLQGRRRRNGRRPLGLETGEFDYAWNLQLAPDVIAEMEAEGGKAFRRGFGTLVERLTSTTTPIRRWATRSAIRPHPFLANPAVRPCPWPSTARFWSRSAMARRAG
jgi:peptide/nickel transport system substrate-binding protein